MNDPLYSPQWIALTREAGIASQSISAGLTALRKANYAANGLYSHAFFSLSIGFERLLKLVYLIDFAILNGRFPTDQELRSRFGHDITKLYSYAVGVHERLPKQDERFPLLRGGIEDSIINFLSKFALTARYYNLNFLTGTATKQTDPIAEWYEDIGALVLAAHYSARHRERVERNASIIDQMLGSFSTVHHTAEDGSPLTDVRSASLHTGENAIVQKYGTFYCAKIARFFYMILFDINNEAHKARLPLPYLCELFFPFMNDDKYLLSRTTFAPLGQ